MQNSITEDRPQTKLAAQQNNPNIGGALPSGSGITPADIAQRNELKAVVTNGATEWHGAHPRGAGAEKDGFILNEDGTSWDRKTGTRYTSTETAELYGISPDEYEPVRAFRAGRPYNPPSAPRPRTRAQNPAQPPTASKSQKPHDTRALEARGITSETMAAFGIVAKQSARAGDYYQYPTLHPDGTPGRLRFKFRDAVRAGGGDSAKKNSWGKDGDGGSGTPFGYPMERIQPGTRVCFVNGEVSVWSCWQSGIPAVCGLGESSKGNTQKVLAHLHTQGCTAEIILDNDVAGRAGAMYAAECARGLGLDHVVRGWPDDAKEGFDASDLGEQCRAEGTDFAAALAALPIIDSTAPAVIEEEEAPFEFSTDSDLDDHLTGIEWEWERYIPKGFLTGLVGEQDQGKSMVAQGFCDIILRGGRWPDGTARDVAPDTKLLWIDTEGSIALFHERAKQWGMPRGRFILPKDPLQELTIDNAANWRWIERAIEQFHPPLVIIDALSGAHGGKENANDEMKAVMKKLATLAQQFNIAIVVIHHLSKPAPGVSMYPITVHRLRGASAISQYCRSILAVSTPDPARPEERRLDVIKLNLARKPEPVGYQLTDAGPAWGTAPEPPKEPRAIDGAMDFLEIALANGPRLSSDVEAEAKAAGIGNNALQNAKKAMNIKSLREGGKDGRWFMHPAAYRAVNDGIEEGGIE